MSKDLKQHYQADTVTINRSILVPNRIYCDDGRELGLIAWTPRVVFGELLKVDMSAKIIVDGQSVGVMCNEVDLRTGFKWPEWLNAYCIAKDSDGRWFGYTELPRFERVRMTAGWDCGTGGFCCLSTGMFVIDFPDVEPEESLIINPAYRASVGSV